MEAAPSSHPSLLKSPSGPQLFPLLCSADVPFLLSLWELPLSFVTHTMSYFCSLKTSIASTLFQSLLFPTHLYLCPLSSVLSPSLPLAFLIQENYVPVVRPNCTVGNCRGPTGTSKGFWEEPNFLLYHLHHPISSFPWQFLCPHLLSFQPTNQPTFYLCPIVNSCTCFELITKYTYRGNQLCNIHGFYRHSLLLVNNKQRKVRRRNVFWISKGVFQASPVLSSPWS